MPDLPIVGVWRLVRYTTRYEGGPDLFPYGEDALGYLSYSPDGFMSGTLSRAGRAPFAVADRLRAGDAEKAQAFDDYLAYCGRWRVDGDTVYHQVELSLLPNWIGEEQPRRMRLHEGGRRMTLTGEWLVRGERRTATIEWERA